MKHKTGQEARKLAAIMFTDIVGYSAITQKNESLALELLETHRRILRSLFSNYNGIEIETIGDAFFVKFSSALEAARCAVEIQQKLRDYNTTVSPENQIKIRIGLHLGDIVQRGKQVMGDGVNIAARIEPLAEAGGICISEDVARQIQNKIDLPIKKLGEGELKNISTAVDIYKIVLPWEKEHNSFTEQLFFSLRKKKIRRYLAGIFLLFLFLFISLWNDIPEKNIPVTIMSNEKPGYHLAVLPFANISAEIENEYFTDGMTEELISVLSRINGLRVIARTSINKYKGTEKNISEIGRELGVEMILEGSVRRADNNLRITIQLVETDNQEQLWSNIYNREMKDVFLIQSDIAHRVAHALQIQLQAKESQRIKIKSTNNLEAYDLYLKGRYHWNKHLPDEFLKGIGYFEQSLKHDSTFALAYSGLADSYSLLGGFNVYPPDDVYPKAKKAALKALEIDSALAEAHISLAFAALYCDWDWTKAENEFKKGIALNPGYALGYHWYYFFLTAMGRFEESNEIKKLALELDPYSVVLNAEIGLGLYFEREYDASIQQNIKTLKMNPLFHAAYIPLGGAYLQKSIFKEAYSTLSKATMFSKGHPTTVAALGYAYAVSGRDEDAYMILELLIDSAKEKYVSPYWMAAIYTGLGEKDKAFEWLEKAYNDHDGSMIFLKVIPIFDTLRSNQRFDTLLNKLKLN